MSLDYRPKGGAGLDDCDLCWADMTQHWDGWTFCDRRGDAPLGLCDQHYEELRGPCIR